MATRIDAETLRWGIEKLGAAFPPSFPDDRAIEEKALLWKELLDDHEWVTGPVFTKGVTLICWQHKGDFIPPPAVALDFFHEAQRQVRAETEKALPPPPKPGGPDDPGQVGAKEEARAYLARLGLAKVGGFDGRAGAAPLRKRGGPGPLTEDEVAAAYERRGLEREEV
jgi:hypothetical protein